MENNHKNEHKKPDTHQLQARIALAVIFGIALMLLIHSRMQLDERAVIPFEGMFVRPGERLLLPRPEMPVADRLNRPIVIPDNIQHIVTIGPGITRMVMALGYSDKIIATDVYSAPLLEQDLFVIDPQQIDVQHITALRPCIIFAADDTVTQMGGITTVPVVFFVEQTSITEINQDILFMARVMDSWMAGNILITNIYTDALGLYRFATAYVNRRYRVYFETSTLPHSVGHNTLFHNILGWLGAENIFAQQEGIVIVACEDVFLAAPDIIITTVSTDAVNEIKTRPGWCYLSAVINGRVYFVDTGGVALPTANVVDIMLNIVEILYPELFSAGD